jgi:hypothetical protein
MINKEMGFSPEKEKAFLKRLEESGRRENLIQELKTQLEEDFGMVEFILEYRFDDKGNLYDPKSGQRTVELTTRGGREEETESIKKIEQGLREDKDSTWIGFSPKNEKYNYPSNCVDFWRVTDEDRVVWSRMVVKEGFEDMNQIRSFLSGEKEVKDESEILASPIGTSGLKLIELFDLFRLNNVRNSCSLELIERVVKDYTGEFEASFGKSLTEDSDLIFRLYSACYRAISRGYVSEGGEILNRRDLRNYMYGEMQRVTQEESFGCAVTTMVGEFGDKVGYYIVDGQVKYGEIPEGYKECKKCGCWYNGEKCPFC